MFPATCRPPAEARRWWKPGWSLPPLPNVSSTYDTYSDIMPHPPRFAFHSRSLRYGTHTTLFSPDKLVAQAQLDVQREDRSRCHVGGNVGGIVTGEVDVLRDHAAKFVLIKKACIFLLNSKIQAFSTDCEYGPASPHVWTSCQQTKLEEVIGWCLLRLFNVNILF